MDVRGKCYSFRKREGRECMGQKERGGDVHGHTRVCHVYVDGCVYTSVTDIPRLFM